MSGRIRTLLRIRALAERRALGALAGGQRRVAAAQERVARTREVTRPRTPSVGQVGAAQLRALQLQGIGGHERVEEAAAALQDACAQRDRLREEWSTASTGRKSVERLAERRHADAVAAAEAARQRRLDELALLRRQRGAP